MKRYLAILFYLIALSRVSNAQVPMPAADQKGTILLINATAHLGTGKVIDQSAIAFKDGKLTMVADAKTIKLDKSAFDTIIDISGKHVYPGFIAPNSTLGLIEIGAVRATRDMKEVGSLNPNARAIIAYSTDSKITPTARSNGILMAQITPRGSIISGTSSIVELEGWNWEDAVYRMDDGIHLNWPKSYRSTGWSGAEKKDADKGENKKIERLKSLFQEARAYSRTKNPGEMNLKLEAMKGLFDGSKGLFIHVDNVKGIVQSIDFSKEYSVKKMVIVGGADSWMVTDKLKEENIAVMVRRIHSKPRRQDADVDLPYKLPKLLSDAGILFCLENSGDMEAAGTRNLPFYAGTCAAYGLSKEEALMAITYNTAKILGIEKSVGSLVVDLDATLIVSSGDALDMKSNDIQMAYVRGKLIDLDNHQKELYRKFKNKYEK
ncbi:MAG TPA: amidohydrolase [Flavobacteriales bacterium]|nr:amidohydrolase [Flavobacteriales bacterium]HIA13188.1 amidohydrolase [Flavobacteriales bacterium]HIO72611.1 amidohydrolase [Flavobacteriales bacterium]